MKERGVGEASRVTEKEKHLPQGNRLRVWWLLGEGSSLWDILVQCGCGHQC